MRAAAESSYPVSPADRTRWILARRSTAPVQRPLDAFRPHHFFIEIERAHSGDLVPVATIFLTNSECPWRCVFCDLWKSTLSEAVTAGAIPAQLDHALTSLGPARQVKLYNSGSFFDRRAIPPQDWPAIAARLRGCDHVIVECHPALIDAKILEFRDLLPGGLEIAMGLETAHPVALEKLNKGITLESFQRAAAFLRSHDIALRVFLLVHPPFIPFGQAALWVRRSIDAAFDCGASVVSLIPTRAGNGALDALTDGGLFREPSITELEDALAYGVSLNRGRVFADLWDADRFARCPDCRTVRVERLRKMNLSQRVPPPIQCPSCNHPLCQRER